ncbi:NUDIX domain-containing protein [Jiangella mangrovi]|uniref:8-oxo-dGTP pyrophosphatase MutT (NUDIX family) n=1 Tax=Jiangella mangrovi TaxID=1524084 RepID=A0A7W9LPG1_9ACTN|nr:NUDIX domain-containing protein [Jiangella mangrovi]MBB5791368.1 8-oxo-dGTP pyrophosphatase MutT (NUDIX family) [Jiangella mangrovi]
MTLVHHRHDGDGWVDCDCGQRHWGRFGAAGLLLVDDERGALLQHRALWSHHGGTWGVPGGARSSAETALEAALREAAEEAAVPPDAVRPSHAWVEDHGTWSYTTIVAHLADPARPVDARPADPESLDITWVPLDSVGDLPLLPAFGAMWPRILASATAELVLVVDAANVVGSRPDGWWRDRAGATARLRDELSLLSPVPAASLGLPATHWWPRIVLVAEGKARGVPSLDGVTVIDAPGSGDDAIAAAVASAVTDRPQDHVIAVTADRELRSRVDAAGGEHIGPSTLFELAGRRS